MFDSRFSRRNPGETNIIAIMGISDHHERGTMSIDTVNEKTSELDAREIDGEPFGEIMAALDSLPDDGTLVLINSFEPVPLYTVLEQRGYTYETSQVAEDEWRVSITAV